MATHVVKQGESLTTIADRYGYDRKTLLDHGDNAELKKKRPNPNVLAPGDKVAIPDRKLKSVAVATGQSHSFKVHLPKVELKLVLRHHDGEPIAGEAYVLEVSRDRIEGSTTGDGELSAMIPAGSDVVKLTVAGRTLKLQCSFLDPLAEVSDEGASGARERLRNLGYAVGDARDLAHRSIRTALALFQHDSGLEVTGDLDDATRGKLADVHGS